MHIFTPRVLPTWLPRKTMVMSLERRDILAKDPQSKRHHKDHSPLTSLELPTRNDLVPRCCLRIYDDSPFKMLRYPYMLPSMTITSLSIVPQISNDQGYLLTKSRITRSKGQEEKNALFRVGRQLLSTFSKLILFYTTLSKTF